MHPNQRRHHYVSIGHRVSQASPSVYLVLTRQPRLAAEKGEAVTASYDIQGGTVQVILRDKSQVKFYQAISGSGARYTNATGTFWEHQGEATYSVGDNIIFVGRVK